MSMRDSKGKFLKRVKDVLQNSEPATLEHMLLLPDRAEGQQQEFMEMKDVSVDRIIKSDDAHSGNEVALNEVPNNKHVRQSTRRSNVMSATVTIIGNLVQDPELRTTNSGKSVVNFALAYTPKRPDGSDGNTNFYNIVAWEYLADNFSASFKKGDRLVVVGRLQQEKWNDKDTDKQMSRLAVTADEIGGTCRFHTVEMSRVKTTKPVTEAVEEPEEADIFAS